MLKLRSLALIYLSEAIEATHMLQHRFYQQQLAESCHQMIVVEDGVWHLWSIAWVVALIAEDTQ